MYKWLKFIPTVLLAGLAEAGSRQETQALAAALQLKVVASDQVFTWDPDGKGFPERPLLFLKYPELKSPDDAVIDDDRAGYLIVPFGPRDGEVAYFLDSERLPSTPEPHLFRVSGNGLSELALQIGDYTAPYSGLIRAMISPDTLAAGLGARRLKLPVLNAVRVDGGKFHSTVRRSLEKALRRVVFRVVESLEAEAQPFLQNGPTPRLAPGRSADLARKIVLLRKRLGSEPMISRVADAEFYTFSAERAARLLAALSPDHPYIEQAGINAEFFGSRARAFQGFVANKFGAERAARPEVFKEFSSSIQEFLKSRMDTELKDAFDVLTAMEGLLSIPPDSTLRDLCRAQLDLAARALQLK